MNENIKNEVKDTKVFYGGLPQDVENTIQNGVKHTDWFGEYEDYEIDTIIQDGIKETTPGGYLGFVKRRGKTIHQFEHSKQNDEVGEVITDGIKNTGEILWRHNQTIEDTIQNGIKDTQDGFSLHDYKVDEIIQDGIKQTEKEVSLRTWKVGEVIVDGVKETITPGDGDIESTIKWMKENKTNSVPDMIDDVIDNGIKVTRGINIDISIVNDTIENGIKETYYDEGDYLTESRVQNTIDNGVKVTYSDMVPTEYDWRKEFVDDVEEAIQNGVKDTIPKFSIGSWWVEYAIENGVKETKDALSNRLPNPVGNVIENGIKQIKSVSGIIGDVLDSSKGVHTYADEYTQNSWVNTVLENGIKGTYAWDDDILGEPDKLPKVINEGNKTEKF